LFIITYSFADNNGKCNYLWT